MRTSLTVVHRWAGLLIAGFLFVAGITGAVISWNHEIDTWLNPHMRRAVTQGERRSALDLARLVERRDARLRVTFLTLAPEDGASQSLSVAGRVDPATGRRYDLGYNQVFLDPVTGEELGRRQWGQVWPITRETLISFLYRLHYSLHIPALWGIDRWGVWLMGGVAVIWLIDCFVGFYLTLPVRKAATAARPASVERQLGKRFWARWKPAWRIKTGGSAYRINFDIHRACSLWTWAILAVLAFTSFSLNLNREAFHPLLSTISTVTPTPFDQRTARDPIEPKLSYEDVVSRAGTEAKARGWTAPAGSVFYSAAYGIFGVRFFSPGDDDRAAGVGPAALYYDGVDGRLLGDRQPWKGTAADIFVQMQFPMHSGRIFGLPGRILISVMGLVVAALSVTGVVIWWRKRKARVARQRKRRVQYGAAPAE